MASYAQIKQFLKNSIASLAEKGAVHVIAGSFLTKFVAFFGSVFIVRFMSKTDYGILSYYETLINYFNIIAGFGFTVGIQRYMVLSGSDPLAKGCYIRALTKGSKWNAALLAVAVALCLFYPHPEGFAGYKYVGIVLALCMPFNFIVEASQAALRARFEYKKYAALTFITTAVIIFFRAAGAAWGGLRLTSATRLFAEAFCAVACVYYICRVIFKNVAASKPDREFGKKMDTYSFQMMFTNGLWAVFMLNDLFLLGQLCGDEEMIADFKVAYTITANLSLLTYAIQVFVAPYYTKKEHEKDYQWIRKNLRLTIICTMLVMVACAFMCYILAKPLVLLAYGKGYLSAVPIIQLLLVASFLSYGIRSSIASALSAMGMQKHNLIVAGGGICLQVILDVLFIPRFGGYGVAYSAAIIHFVMSLALGYIAWNKFYRVRPAEQ